MKINQLKEPEKIVSLKFTKPKYVSSDYNHIEADWEIAVPDNWRIRGKYTPIKGDKLYIHGDCIVPRAKLYSYAKDNDVHITRNIENADVIITAGDVETGSLSYHDRIINKEVAVKFIEEVRDTDNSIDWDNILRMLSETAIDSVMISNGESVLIGEDTFRGRTVKLIDEDNIDENITCWKDKIQVGFTNNKDIMSHLEMLRTTDKRVYSEWDILMQINTTSVTEETYHTIYKMLQSGDSGSNIIALEAMANSNYDRSIQYLLRLLYKYGDRIRSEMPTRNHVNFKAMLAYLGLNKIYYRLDCDDMLYSLMLTEQLNEENSNWIKSEAMKVITANSRLSYFKVAAVNIVTAEAVEQDTEVVDE